MDFRTHRRRAANRDDRAPATTWCSFGPLHIEYDVRVLEPRIWTLEQSRWAAELSLHAPPGPILELCAGAGHIGLAAAVLCDRDLVQVDSNPVAAEFATRNAERAGWAHRTRVRSAQVLSGIHPDETFPLIIADPPYLRSTDVSRFPDDPPVAIDGGPDGLAVISDCLDVAALHLKPSGSLLLQIEGRRQEESVTDLAITRGLRPRAVRRIDEQRSILLIDAAIRGRKRTP